MGFKFRLESVLKYRQRIVDQQGREVALAQAKVQEWKVRLEKMDREIFSHLSTGNRQSGGGLKVQDMVAKTVWLEHLRHQKDSLVKGLRESEMKLQRARENLKAAWQDLEVLEQLKTKQDSQWAEEIETRERKDLDEIGQIRAERARRSNLALSGE